MSAQPANSTISVYLAARAFRQSHRHESIGALIKNLRPLVMSIPGEEVLVGVISRDTTTKDMSPYMGEARHNAGRGFPIVVGLNDQVSLANAQANVADADMCFQIGNDFFIKTTESGLDGDMYDSLRDLSPDLVV